MHGISTYSEAIPPAPASLKMHICHGFLCTAMPPYAIADLRCAELAGLILCGAFCSHVRMSSRGLSSLCSEAERLDRHAPNDPAAERARPRGDPGVRDEWGSAGRATGHGP